MTERMYRAQILLDPQQHRKLEELAHKEGRSISSVARQVIDAGLACLEPEAETWKKRDPILTRLRAIRERQSQEYPGDLVNESRQERDLEQDELWRHGS